jgi:uncharacterized RDD family membrane protein YckC
MNAEQTPCPLCGQIKRMHKAKPLYGQRVCQKCYYAFANRRQLAFVLDVVGWRLIAFPLALAIGLVVGLTGPSKSTIQILGLVLSFLLVVLFTCKDCFAGHSPGKALCGVKVIDSTTGHPCGIGSSFKRNLPLLIPFMPLIVAYQLCKGHRTGDGWSNTKVIWKKYASNPIFSPSQILSNPP